jgi:uncharacterized protein YjiS (DUF1127 family)
MRTNHPIATIVGAGMADIGVTDRGTAVAALARSARRFAALPRLWRRRRRDRRELGRLDDRTLKDIGLTRSDAEFLINKPFWRE